MEYKVRFVNPQKQYTDHREEFIKAFDETLSRGAIVNREELWKFEEDFAKLAGAKYAIGVNSGTSALDVAMQAAGVGPGDEVITVAHTFIASISIPYLAGAKSVLVDVREDFNMDPELVEKAITPRTKVIEPVHLNGHLCDMDAIMDIAKRHNLIVIEDAAQALTASMKMKDGKIKKAGTFGLVGCFSLYWAKVFGGWGNNGMAVTDDEEIAKKIRLMRYNGEDRETRKFFYHGHNLLMDNVHAALLSVKLKYLVGWLERRKQIAKKYNENLKNISQVKVPDFEGEKFTDVFTNYVIRAERRDELKEHLAKNGVETLISWATPTYKEPVFEKDKPRLVSTESNDATELLETERICSEVISLPMYPELTDEEVQYVIETLKSFYK